MAAKREAVRTGVPETAKREIRVNDGDYDMWFSTNPCCGFCPVASAQWLLPIAFCLCTLRGKIAIMADSLVVLLLCSLRAREPMDHPRARAHACARRAHVVAGSGAVGGAW